MPPSSPTHALAVTGLGMVSSLGHDVAASCAAARAGLLAPVELKSLGTDELFGPEDFDGPPAVFGHAVPGVGEGFSGIGKAIELAAAALSDLLAGRPLTDREQARTGFFVATSDHFVHDAAELLRRESGLGAPGDPLPSARWRERSASLADRLLERAGLPGVTERVVTHGGHPGFAACVADASAKIQRGVIDRALVGGVESRVEPAFLRAAAMLRALKTKDNPVGLTPGEAAAFVMLERPIDAEQRGLGVCAEIRGAAVATDPVHHFGEAPGNGAVLADVIRKVLASDADLRQGLALFLADMNGTERRALDFGHALMRLRVTLERELDLPLWLPAASFGDTGAATGAVSVCLAARAFERGYAPGRAAIIWLSSESGNKGALGITAGRQG